MSEAPKQELFDQNPEKGFDRDAAYEEARESVYGLLRTELKLEGAGADVHGMIVKKMETLAPQKENERILEILARMRVLIEKDMDRAEKAASYPEEAEMVDQLYEAAK